MVTDACYNSAMGKMNFIGACRVFIKLRIKAKRLDFVIVWPRADALSWVCVSGRIWQPDKRCRHHFWILTNFHSSKELAWIQLKGWGADLESETCTSTNQQQTGLRKKKDFKFGCVEIQQVWKWKL